MARLSQSAELQASIEALDWMKRNLRRGWPNVWQSPADNKRHKKAPCAVLAFT